MEDDEKARADVIHRDPPLSPAWQRAMEQAREIRRRRCRDAARSAERLWFEMIKQALTRDTGKRRA